MMRNLIALLLLVVSFHAQASEVLWKRLQTEPNLVVLMRHAYAKGPNPVVWDSTGNCQGESMLTPKGEALARRMGDEFRKRQVSPAVISSPMCRCRDTASLAFGSVGATHPDLREIASANAAQKKTYAAKANELLLKYRGAKPVVFISHRPNIDALTFELIAPGEMLVGKIGSDGEVEVVGRIKPPQ